MERIQIGDNVVVTVLEIRGNKVRIGIAAPEKVRVVRSELKEVILESPLRLVSGVCGLGTASAEKSLPVVLHN
jgi:carbon storage regulator CsrA